MNGLFGRIAVLLTLGITAPSWASKARIDALQSNHLKDPEFSYLFPTKLLEIPNYVTFQSGSTVATDYLLRPYLATKISFNQDQSDNYALGLTLGRQSDLTDAARLTSNRILSSNFTHSSNAVDLNYAVRNLGRSYAINFFYSDQNDKVNKAGNHASTLGFGARLDDFTLVANVSLINDVTDIATASRLVIDQSANAALMFELDDIYFLLDLSSSRAKRLISGIETNDLELLNYKMGIVKNYFNGPETLFYRINLETNQVKNRVTTANTKDVKLPVTLGFESVVSDEMKLRASIKQTVGVYQTDTSTAAENTTSAAIGMGLVFNKLVIDSVFEGLIGSTANQTLNGNQLLTGTSITYWY